MSDTTRASYDRLAATYTDHVSGELAGKPFDRDLLDRFAELTRPLGPIADLGCGPGHVAAYLHDRGAEVIGIDLSPQMIAEARKRFPELRFEPGSMTELQDDGSFGGIIAFYSIIHIERAQQPVMFANWHRALKPGGRVLVAFHLGEQDRHLDELWSVPVELDFLFFQSDEIADRLEAAGFSIEERYERDPYPGVEAETRRGYLLARA
jgi:SAM-dependent methyltransferase